MKRLVAVLLLGACGLNAKGEEPIKPPPPRPVVPAGDDDPTQASKKFKEYLQPPKEEVKTATVRVPEMILKGLVKSAGQDIQALIEIQSAAGKHLVTVVQGTEFTVSGSGVSVRSKNSIQNDDKNLIAWVRVKTVTTDAVELELEVSSIKTSIVLR